MIRTICLGLMLGAAASAAAMLGGCGEPYTGPIGGQYDEYRVYPNVTLSQGTLAEALVFQEPVVTRDEGELMRVVLPLRSRSNDELHIEYRVLWFDDRDRIIEPQMSWTPMRIESRQTGQIASRATSSDATDYNVQIRWGRP